MTPKAFDAGQYWEERLRKRFDLGGVGSIDLSREYNEWLYRLRRHFFRRHIAPLVKRENITSVLDIGSGTGFYIERWLEAGVSSVTGLDITETSVSRLTDAFPQARFLREDIGVPGDPLPKVDAVSAFDVLFHIVDDDLFECAVRRIHSAVRPGGLFLLSDLFQRNHEFHSPHQSGRRLDYIERVLRNAQFVIEWRRPVFITMVDPTDAPNPLWRACWQRVARIASLPGASNALGAILYCADLGLTEILKEGPSIEVMLCRKTGS